MRTADGGPVIIIGAGIGGLTLALGLAEREIACEVFERAEESTTTGVGINILPHASAELARLGLEPSLEALAVLTQEAVFYNRFGQFLYGEPTGRFAGYEHPQFSIHRGDSHHVLVTAVEERIGPIHWGAECRAVDQDAVAVTVRFVDAISGHELPIVTGAAAIGCDGVHSVIRKQLFPDEHGAHYTGVNMWRGLTVWPRLLTGASMVRAGWLAKGKLVAYPIRDNVDGRGSQLVNWLAEIETPEHRDRDWNRAGRLEDFISSYEEWHFDWLDVPAMMRAAETILEYPMVDQDPLAYWSAGRVTLLGDAAHPMVPRGSNGAGQAILDGRALADALAEVAEIPTALARYEAERLAKTSEVVLTNRTNPPDAILRVVAERTGDTPFARLEDFVSVDELREITEGYKQVAGYTVAELRSAP